MPLAEWSDKPPVQNQDDMLFPFIIRQGNGMTSHIDGGKIW